MSTLYTLKLKMWILPLKSRMKICTKREDGFILKNIKDSRTFYFGGI